MRISGIGIISIGLYFFFFAVAFEWYECGFIVANCTLFACAHNSCYIEIRNGMIGMRDKKNIPNAVNAAREWLFYGTHFRAHIRSHPFNLMSNLSVKVQLQIQFLFFCFFLHRRLQQCCIVATYSWCLSYKTQECAGDLFIMRNDSNFLVACWLLDCLESAKMECKIQNSNAKHINVVRLVKEYVHRVQNEWTHTPKYFKIIKTDTKIYYFDCCLQSIPWLDHWMTAAHTNRVCVHHFRIACIHS